jgi:hypothetical protein
MTAEQGGVRRLRRLTQIERKRSPMKQDTDLDITKWEKDIERNLDRWQAIVGTSEYRYWSGIYRRCFWLGALGIVGLLIGMIRLLFSAQKGLWLIGICLLLLLLASVGMGIARRSRSELLSKNGTQDPFKLAPIDTGGIPWCRNCRHFRVIKAWNNSSSGLWQLATKPDNGKLPCLIAEKVLHLWDCYYAQPKEKRTLFPKTCELFERRS